MQTLISRKEASLPNGEKLSYLEAGTSSKVLMIIHGAYMSAEIFTEHIMKLSETFRVVAVDLRGHGHSSFNNIPNTIYDLLEDLKQLIDKMEIPKLSILGWSTGGGLAMVFAAKYPQNIERIIIYGSIGAKGVPSYKFDENGEITGERIKEKEDIMNLPFTQMVKEIIQNKDRDLAQIYLKNVLFNARGKASEQLMERLVNALMLFRAIGHLSHVLNIYNITNESNGVSEGSGEIFKIKCPVLILHGIKDAIIPVKEAKLLKELLKDQAVLKVFEDAGHSVIEDYPKEVLLLVKDFILSENLQKSKL